MIGRRNTKMPTPAGIVSNAVIRMPSPACSTNAGRSLRATARDISGWNVVAIETASRPWGSTKNVNAARYADASPDPGSARLRTTMSEIWLAATKPIVQNDSRRSRPTAGWRNSNTGRKRNPVLNMAGTSTTAIDAMPSVAPSPSVYLSRSLLSTSSSTQSAEPAVRQRQQRGDDDHVRQDRAPRRGEEPAPAVEERVRQPDEPVEQDLDQEDPRQRRADRAEHVGVDAGPDLDRVDPEDQRCGDDGDHGECQHQDDRHAQDDVGGPLVVVLVEGGEQRHERGRQHAAEQQLVHDVRRLVGQAVGVGQGGLAEDVREGDDAEQARHPRQRRPGGDDEIAAEQAAHVRPVSSIAV